MRPTATLPLLFCLAAPAHAREDCWSPIIMTIWDIAYTPFAAIEIPLEPSGDGLSGQIPDLPGGLAPPPTESPTPSTPPAPRDKAPPPPPPTPRSPSEDRRDQRLFERTL